MSIRSQEIAFELLQLADASSILRRDSAALIKKSNVLRTLSSVLRTAQRTLKLRKPAITLARSQMQNCNESAKG